MGEGTEYLKVKDAASILNVSPNHIYVLIRKNELRSIHIGNAVRIKKTDFEKYIKKNTQ